MTVRSLRMRCAHLSEVLPIERDLFTEDTWSEQTFRAELANTDTRHYVVAVDSGPRPGPDEPGTGSTRATVTRATVEAAGDVAGDVVGYAGMCVYTDEAHVLTLGVRRDRQREGIGALLVEWLIAVAAERGVDRILLEVRADNPAAQRLYLRHGFVPIGIRKRYYRPSGTDAVVMRRGGQ